MNSVRIYRKAMDMKQAELASLVDVNQATLSNIEAGRHVPNVFLAMRLADVLECDIYELFVDPRRKRHEKEKER